MDFARKQLEKYGWTEGKGLGKNENGIAKALKPKLKRNVTGVGHDVGADFTDHWWTDLYNKAATNIQVEEKNGKTKKIKTIDSSEFVITNNMWRLKKTKKECKTNSEERKYGDYFIKTELLDGGTAKIKKINTSESESEDEKTNIYKMTDEELFAACEGRTAHKGARHGIKALGKLARIEQQEKLLLTQTKYESYSCAKPTKNQLTNSPELCYSNLVEDLVKGNVKKYKSKSFAKCNNIIENCDSSEVTNNMNLEEVSGNASERIWKMKKKKKMKECDQESREYNVNYKNDDNMKVKKHRKKICVSKSNNNLDNVQYKNCNLEITDNSNTSESKTIKHNVDSNTDMLVMNVKNELELALEQHFDDIDRSKERKKSEISHNNHQNSKINKNVDIILTEMQNIDEVHNKAVDILNNTHNDDKKIVLSIKKKKKKKGRKVL